MNGPEHYREAERLVDRANATTAEGNYWQTELQRAALAASAQVHATLAVAAATAYPAARDYYGDESRATRAWAEVVES